MTPLYQVDAFTNQRYKGNPAAVCILHEWPEDEVLQNIAAEINLSETAFVIDEGSEHFQLRWFTPKTEVKLCGHATLAAAHIIMTELRPDLESISFDTRYSGVLKVSRSAQNYILDFPADNPKAVDKDEYLRCIDQHIVKAYTGREDLMLVLESEDAVLSCKADFIEVKETGFRTVMITAKSNNVDFVSRVFAPFVGIDEDPVTGSAYTLMAPYWAENLALSQMSSIQLSDRRGFLNCELKGNRVLLSGQAVTVIKGALL